MALKEQDIVFTTTDEAGNPVIQFPITRVENVEDAVRTVNKKKPDSNGDIQIDVDMSHLATKDELTKGLANKRDHTIQIANADLNTLLEDKTWACSGTLKNTPIACTFCIVQVYDTGAPVSGNIVQVCYVPNLTDNTVRTFWRNCNNGVTFGKWSESGAVKTVNSIAPDASGEVTLPNATTSKAGLVRLAAEEDVLNEAPQTAVCTQLIYEINEFRRKSTAYQVGDKVACAFQYERFLECTKAGKTSAELLDTRNVTHGQVIADGMVEWTVRTHVRSIGGYVADENGDVPLAVAVKKIVLDAYFPVGSTYLSADAKFDPNTAWGGTWEKIENRFLLGAGARAVGAVGGEEAVTLNEMQIPSHSHGVGSINMTGGMTAGRFHNWGVSIEGAVYEWNEGGGGSGNADGSGYNRQGFRFDGSRARGGSTGWTGSGASHNNMPPFEVVNIWKRTA